MREKKRKNWNKENSKKQRDKKTGKKMARERKEELE